MEYTKDNGYFTEAEERQMGKCLSPATHSLNLGFLIGSEIVMGVTGGKEFPDSQTVFFLKTIEEGIEETYKTEREKFKNLTLPQQCATNLYPHLKFWGMLLAIRKITDNSKVTAS